MTIQTGKGSATSSSSRSPGPGAALRAPRIGAWFQVPEAGAIAPAILLFGFFAIASAGRGFVSVAGTANWLNTASDLGVIAVPIGLLMIAGEFDLSIGSMVGASSVTVGIVSGYYHDSLLLGVGRGSRRHSRGAAQWSFGHAHRSSVLHRYLGGQSHPGGTRAGSSQRR